MQQTGFIQAVGQKKAPMTKYMVVDSQGLMAVLRGTAPSTTQVMGMRTEGTMVSKNSKAITNKKKTVVIKKIRI